MARALALGGTGFIGSHACDALREAGLEVRVLTRDPAAAAERWPGASESELVRGDFLDADAVASALSGVDVVLHLAATTNPASSAIDPIRDVEENVKASVAILERCVAADIGKILFASTGGAIYGAYPGRPVTESDPALPMSPYAIGKLAVEGYLRFFRAKYGLASTALRISNPYGPRQNPSAGQGVIATFLHRALRDEPVTVFGDGSTVRDYIYVEDVARIIAGIAASDRVEPVVNVGSGRGTSVLVIRDLLAAAIGRPIATAFEAARPSDVPKVVLDASLLKSAFGFAATTPLETGIAMTVEAALTRP